MQLHSENGIKWVKKQQLQKLERKEWQKKYIESNHHTINRRTTHTSTLDPCRILHAEILDPLMQAHEIISSSTEPRRI